LYGSFCGFSGGFALEAIEFAADGLGAASALPRTAE
jgi:hypothetical protein